MNCEQASKLPAEQACSPLSTLSGSLPTRFPSPGAPGDCRRVCWNTGERSAESSVKDAAGQARCRVRFTSEVERKVEEAVDQVVE